MSARVLAFSQMVPARFADLLERADRDRLEIIGGEIVQRAVPSPAHATAELRARAAPPPAAPSPDPAAPAPDPSAPPP